MIALKRILTAFLLSALLMLSACSTKAPSRFDQAQQESTQRGAQAVAKDAVSGGSFNKYFPAARGEYQLVFAQEKQGFAQAKLKKDGQEVAMLTITDTTSNPAAANKYMQSTDNINGYPVVKQGNKGTGLLVDNRFQVKVVSRNNSFTEEDRQEWLRKFDLAGLDRLK